MDQKITEAYQLFDELPTVGIALDAITQQLEDEGVAKFIAAFDQLMISLKGNEATLNKRLK